MISAKIQRHSSGVDSDAGDSEDGHESEAEIRTAVANSFDTDSGESSERCLQIYTVCLLILESREKNLLATSLRFITLIAYFMLANLAAPDAGSAVGDTRSLCMSSQQMV